MSRSPEQVVSEALESKTVYVWKEDHLAVTAVVHALREAGLLVEGGSWEYGTSIPEAIQEDAHKEPSEEWARTHVKRCNAGCVLVRRLVGPWERVEEGKNK
ncbi:hypothetical protein [Microbacterium sp. YY-01]|uniref:hypothetical protein n=1 Tax=Microbacterium sp. YY-01 TaxID=3421634 RepID=UPI003D1805B5